MMLKFLSFALLLLTASGISAASAQTMGPDASSSTKAAQPANKNYLTSIGETVPHPGASQGASTTDLDRIIEQKNDRLDHNICSNCD